MNKILIMIFCVLFSASCAKSKHTTQTKLSIFSGQSGQLASGIQMSGGVIIIGHTLNDTDKFKIALHDASDEKVLNLRKGKWEFAAIGWDGASPFQGNNRCAYVGDVDLNADDMAITFNLDYATCAGIPNHGAVFSNVNFMDSNTNPNQFKPINFKSCDTLIFPSDPADRTAANCTGVGLTGSFMFAAMGGQEGANAQAFPPLPTSCYTSLDANGLLLTNLRLPVGNYVNGKKENITEFGLFLFQTTDCSGPAVQAHIKDGMYTGINEANMKIRAENSASYNTLYVEHNSSTISNNVGYNPYGYGKDGVLNVTSVINQTQESYGHITGITANPPTITIAGNSAASTPGFAINNGDEIIWFVNSESGPGCGGGFVPGMFGFVRVVGKVTSTDTTFTLEKSITEYMLSAPNPGVMTTLAIPANFNTPCSMQIVRVPQYKDILVSGTSAALIAFPYNAGNGYGGILPLKVSNKINISTSATNGFGLGATGKGNNGVMQTLCGASGKRCLKMGDLNSGPGGSGGGIVLARINEIHFETSAGDFSINSDGAAGTTSQSGGNGGMVITKIGKITFAGSSATPSILQSVNLGLKGAGGAADGNLGSSHFEYCENLNNVILTGASNSFQDCTLDGGI